MEDSTLARTPVTTTPETVVEKGEPVTEEAKAGKSDALPSDRAKPYLTEILEMGETYNHFNMKELVTKIDLYIKEKSEDTNESYQKAFDELYKKVNVNGSVYDVVEKISEWVDIQTKLEQVIKEKEEFEAKDPLKMSVKELQRWAKKQGIQNNTF